MNGTIAILTPAGKLSRVFMESEFLKQLQTAVEGHVQVVSLTDTMDMWCNEEGKMNGSEWNESATAIWHAMYGPTDAIFGTVVFSGTPDSDGNTRGISNEDFARLELVAEAARRAGNPV